MECEERRRRGDVDFCAFYIDVGEVLHHRQDEDLLWVGSAGGEGGGFRTFWILWVDAWLGQVWEGTAGSLGISGRKTVTTRSLAHLLPRSVCVGVWGTQRVDG